MEMKLLGFSRSFENPGAPIVWTIGVRMDFGSRKLVSVVQEEATNDELNIRAVAEGKTSWDEGTLVAHSTEKHTLTDPITIEVPPARGP